MKKTLLLFVFIIGVATASIVLAAPPGSPYSPGETLDPACAPGATNCTVVGALTEADASLQTTNDTPTLLYSLPVAEGTAVNFEVSGIAASGSVTDRYLFHFGGLFYRQPGGNVSQQDATLNLGGPITTSGPATNFGGATTEYDINEPFGQPQFTWNGNGTDPNFLSNGLTTAMMVTINGVPHPALNGTFMLKTVTDDYIEIDNPGVGYSDVGVVGISISTSGPTATITLSANTGTQSIDVLATGLAGTTINWNAGIQYKTVTAP